MTFTTFTMFTLADGHHDAVAPRFSDLDLETDLRQRRTLPPERIAESARRLGPGVRAIAVFVQAFEQFAHRPLEHQGLRFRFGQGAHSGRHRRGIETARNRVAAVLLVEREKIAGTPARRADHRLAQGAEVGHARRPLQRDVRELLQGEDEPIQQTAKDQRGILLEGVVDLGL